MLTFDILAYTQTDSLSCYTYPVLVCCARVHGVLYSIKSICFKYILFVTEHDKGLDRAQKSFTTNTQTHTIYLALKRAENGSNKTK